MLTSWGFTENQIIVHYLEGMGPDNMQSLNSGNHQFNDIDFNAQESAIENTFTDLESNLTPNDILVVYISSHGQNILNEGTRFDIPDGVIYDSELAGMVENIDCSSMFFLLNFCHAGGFVDNLAIIDSASSLSPTLTRQ